jgi:hypothetical protein
MGMIQDAHRTRFDREKGIVHFTEIKKLFAIGKTANRSNVFQASQLVLSQPRKGCGVWQIMEHRLGPLVDGFVLPRQEMRVN